MKQWAQLLNKTEAEASRLIGRLEEISGWPSEDARLLADTNQKVRVKIASLGLDPDDTTAEELYHALLAKYHYDITQMDRALGVGPQSSGAERAAKAVELVGKVIKPADGWFVKTTLIKKYLLAHPPKKLMKELHYRSAASMVKHESLAGLVLAAEIEGSDTWLKAFHKMLAKLDSAAYELRPAKVIGLARHSAGRAQAVASNNQLGFVGVFAGPDHSAFSLALLAIEELQKINSRQAVNLENVHPLLNWWLDARHLLSSHGGQTVSLNLHDVAKSHFNNTGFDSRHQQSAQAALWGKLKESYHKYLRELPQEVEDKVTGIPRTLDQPALETIEI